MRQMKNQTKYSTWLRGMAIVLLIACVTALVPSYTAFAISDISALVGREFVIMDSSISVAVITRLPSMRHFVISFF